MRFEPRKTENRNRKGWSVFDLRDGELHSSFIWNTRKACLQACEQEEAYFAEIDAANAREDALREAEAARKAARKASAVAARRTVLLRAKVLEASQMAFAF